MKTMPCRRVKSRSIARNSGEGGTSATTSDTGSSSTAASCSACGSRMRSAASGSFQGITIVSLSTPCGTPTALGTGTGSGSPQTSEPGQYEISE